MAATANASFLGQVRAAKTDWLGVVTIGISNARLLAASSRKPPSYWGAFRVDRYPRAP
jgi:hypothetical protein